MTTYTYEPPRSNLPPGVNVGVVRGKYVRAIDDGVDANINTDAIPANGTITFTPSAPYVTINGVTVILETRTAILDHTGEFLIELVSTTNSGPATNWDYRVDFNIPGLRLPSYNILVPPGLNADLSTLTPVVSRPPTYTTKGDKGDKGDLSIVGLNVFVDAQGDLAIDDNQIMLWGTGNPNGVLTKPKASLYVDLGGTTDFLYVKTTATGDTGWVVIK